MIFLEKKKKKQKRHHFVERETKSLASRELLREQKRHWFTPVVSRLTGTVLVKSSLQKKKKK